MTKQKMLGLIVGFAGVATMSAGGFTGDVSAVGIILALVTALSWALGTAYVKKIGPKVDSTWLTAMQITIGGVILLLAGSGMEDWSKIQWNGTFIWDTLFIAVFVIAAGCDHIYVMLLVEPYYQTFTNKEIADASKTNEVIVCVSADSREQVDEIVNKALEAGGKPSNDKQDHGFMYGWSFQDLDNHLWEVMYMDPSAVQQHNEELGGIGVAVADRPEGPFRDALGKPLIDQFYHGAQPIDPHVFIDDDGQAYLYYGGWKHCNVVKLNEDMVSIAPFSDGEVYKEITPENFVEGPCMIKREGKYYFMWAEGGWGGPDYSVGYAVSDSPLGPFVREAKILQQDPEVATGAGHHGVIQIPGEDEWYIVYHRRPLSETAANHREVCIDRMEFDHEGRIRPVKLTFEGVPPRTLPTHEKSDSRIYARFGREIYVVAKQGEPDPESNRALKVVLERAKTYNVPKAIIDRALEKARGNSDETYDELRGSVAYMFDSTAVIGVEDKTEEEVLELLMEADVDVRDIIQEDDSVIVYADPEQFHAVQEAFQNAGVTEFSVAEVSMIAQNYVELPAESQPAFEKMIDALENLEDVQNVYHNVELED
ncbi:hypothetical protein BGX30_004727 [Mortierella sp. GBA39]|nr:hypothetical protein BGX30_004727 [Mortierella sp. GBA39]